MTPSRKKRLTYFLVSAVVVLILGKFISKPLLTLASIFAILSIFIFSNNNDPKIYISSADWMTRNIDNRVEVSCPIYDTDIKKELQDIQMK